MPDNHFESNVKQKLDELNFSPSEAIWQKVEEQIKKDNDRRRLLIWLPLLGLLLGWGIWFFLPGKSILNTANQSNVSLNAEKNKLKIPSGQSALLKKKSPVAAKIEKLIEQKTFPNAVATKNPGVELKHRGNAKAGKKIPHYQSAENRNGHQPPKTATITSDDKINSNQSPVATDSTVQEKSIPSKWATADSMAIPERKKITNDKKNKMQWGISAGAGLSSIPMNFNHENALNYSTTPSSLTGYSTIPSQKQSLSFHLGFLMEKLVNKTTAIFTGIQYSYSGVKTERGNLVNQPFPINAGTYTAANIYAYYAPTSTGNYNYTNHYHFIEIPLGMEKKLGNKSRFSLNAGISVAWLVSTNALQYDPHTGIYYQDNSYFKKTQINIFGGIQYRLLQKEKYSLKLGPQVQYGLTRLLNNKSPYTEHLFYGGLKLVLISNRK